MSTKQPERPSLSISHGKLLAFINSMIGNSIGREDDEHPLPPGPWDPVIRLALKQVYAAGPQPEPWRIRGATSAHLVPWKVMLASILGKHPEAIDGINSGHHFSDEVALNPQPLPPRIAFMMSVAQQVISRAELLQELSVATTNEGEQRGIIIVGGYITRFVDDICGNGFRLKYPFPGPPPPWFAPTINGIDLVVIATQFDQAAREAFSPELRQHLVRASEQLLDVGVARMR